MNTLFEPAMSALYAQLVGAANIPFAATSIANSAQLVDVVGGGVMFPGLPVLGPGVAAGTTIASIDAAASTLTLSQPVGAAGAGAFSTGFQTTDRRVTHWTLVKAQPALFLRRLGTTDEYDHETFFSRTTLECEAWIYSRAGSDPDVAPDIALSNLDGLVRQSFVPDAGYGEPRCTLGGLAYWCRIEGRSDYAPGDQGGQGISRIPIRITLP